MNLLHPLNLDLNPGKEAANRAHGSMDQIREKQNRKTKIICSSSSQCHQIIRYQQKLAATEEEGIRQQRQKRVLLSSALLLGNGDTQNITIHISTFEEKCKSQITSLCAESSNHFRICALSIDKILTTQSVKRNPPKKDLRYSWGSF